jgi:hypothetical protein
MFHSWWFEWKSTFTAVSWDIWTSVTDIELHEKMIGRVIHLDHDCLLARYDLRTYMTDGIGQMFDVIRVHGHGIGDISSSMVCKEKTTRYSEASRSRSRLEWQILLLGWLSLLKMVHLCIWDRSIQIQWSSGRRDYISYWMYAAV